MNTSTAKRGRPVSLEKREAILKAASRLFSEKGYAISMDEIASEAGVSKQTLYGHFSNKETLFRAYAASWKSFYLEGIEPSHDPWMTLEVLAQRVLRKLLSEKGVMAHRLLIQQSPQFPDLAKLHDEVGPCHSLALVAAHLRQMMDRKLLREADTMQAAEDFFGLVMGQVRVRRLFGGIGELPEEFYGKRAHHAVDIFRRAYGV